MKTWDILKGAYLIALLHIANENTTYLCEISRYIKYIETRTKHLLCGIKGVYLINYSSQTRSTPFILRLLDSLVVGNKLAKFGKNLSSGFFSGE